MLLSFKHSLSTAAKRSSSWEVLTGNTDANNICFAAAYPGRGVGLFCDSRFVHSLG